MKHMKVSVAMITYCSEKYGVEFLLQQLDSIKNQTRKVDEVYIADDCSTDKTVEIVQKYIDDNNLENWIVYCNEKNLGFTKNSLSAIMKTTGDVVFLADQDDIWLETKVEEVLKVYKNEPDAMLVSTRFTYIDGNNKPIPDPFYENGCGQNDGTYNSLGIKWFLGTSFVPGCALSIRGEMREQISKIGMIDLNKSLGNDWFLHMCAISLGKEYRLNRPLFLRRFHTSNLSMQGFRSKKLLKGDKKKRKVYLTETIYAHKYFYNNEVFRAGVSNEDLELLKKTIDLWELRLRFFETKNPVLGITLLKYKKNYKMTVNNLDDWRHPWLADIGYTYFSK